MIEQLNQLAQGYNFYTARRQEFAVEENQLPFRISPKPFEISRSELEEITNMGGGSS
jgi:hypothetical protein